MLNPPLYLWVRMARNMHARQQAVPPTARGLTEKLNARVGTSAVKLSVVPKYSTAWIQRYSSFLGLIMSSEDTPSSGNYVHVTRRFSW